MDAAGSEGDRKKPPEGGESKVKRKMKTASQLEILEKTYAVETYPSESLRADLSAQLGLSDRQLQMWFCHRRLKDRKTPPAKRPRKDASPAAAPVASSSVAGDDMVVGELGNELGSISAASGSSPFGHGDSQQRVVFRAGAAAVPRPSADMPAMKRYYEPPPAISEIRAIAFVEAQLGEPLREDGPILGMEFDPLPPGAFGAPIVTGGQQKPVGRLYEPKIYEQPDAKSIKGAGRALHEYQFLPEQPSVRTDTYDRAAPSHYFGGSPTDVQSVRTPLSSSRSYMHGNEQVASGFGFQGQIPNLSLLPQQGRQGHLTPSISGEYDPVPRKNSYANIGVDANFGAHPVTGLDNPFISSDRQTTQEEEVSRVERKRKNEEARLAKEVEAHEKRIRKELEKQDMLRRKREEQMKKDMERQDRERRKEEERLLRERQREKERFQREQRREMERREKFLQKESIRAEKMRLKEELRREKEAARLKAANDRATARRIAKESTELIEDERLELMELAASSKGLPSILALDCETLQSLDLFRDMLPEFPPKSLHLKRPFAIEPWTGSEENMGNLLMVWRFLITFADVLGLWPFTLDEFVQAFHDYDSRLLGEISVALLRSIIKDIEDVARTPLTGLGANQTSSANPGGGHPHIVEGAYAWGFDIRSWQRHLNLLTWTEVMRQFALSAGFGPKLKKRSVDQAYIRDENEGNDGEDIISNLRNGAAVENAFAIMQERGFSNGRRSRHRLTPGTVKFAAFHVLSLEGSKGLTILDVAEKIQKSGLRDLTTSKTPEASIAAALSRDSKLFERTAPSTYCVRTPYRKDPADADVILSEAREKIQIFKNGLYGEDAEEVERDDVERDDVERDEDSESDVAEDPEDDLDSESKPRKETFLSCEVGRYEAKICPGNNNQDIVSKNLQNGLENCGDVLPMVQSEGFKEVRDTDASVDQSFSVAICNKTTYPDQEDTIIDESNFGEQWVQGLMDGEYSGLSVEERLNALVALIGVANEGNSIRIVLEERMEAANALKKQMWAEAQLDKRRMKEEYVMKMQYPSSTGNKCEPNFSVPVVDGRQSPLLAADEKNDMASRNLDIKQEHFHDQKNDVNYTNNNSSEKPLPMQEFAGGADNPFQQPGYVAEKSRSQLKAYIGHRAEEMYVYRSLPLGLDRRRNRYWQFITSASQNDPGCGRIFVELRDGCWRLIDSEEGFDALVVSLDVRGIREAHLHSMLHKIELSFKETVRRKVLRSNTDIQIKDTTITGFSKMASYLDYPALVDSPCSTVIVSTPGLPESSSSFGIGLGRNETERSDALRRYRDLEKWMWEECIDSSLLCAVKYGKKRCNNQLVDICYDCHDLYFFEDDHCPSCHTTFYSSNNCLNFSEHLAICEEKVKGESDWTLHSSDASSPLRIRLLKAQLALIEVTVPVEALQPSWSEDYRKSWGMKLHSSTSVEELLQLLTLLEGIVKKDYLFSDFESTNELLDFCFPTKFALNKSSYPEMTSVLPWVPPTTGAVALRLMEFDSAIFYTLQQKRDAQRDRGADVVPVPSKYAVLKNIPVHELAETPFGAETLLQDIWIDQGSGHTSSGRGRGTRNRGRGRTRGGRSQRRAIGSRSESGQRSIGINSERFGQLLGWKGKTTRGRGGRRRGRRTVTGRRKPVKRVVKIAGQKDKSKEIVLEKMPRSSGQEWNVEEDETARMMQLDDAESSSSSESSEYDDDTGPAFGNEYDDDDDLAVNDYSGVFSGKSDHLIEGVDYNEEVEEEDDERVEDGDDDYEDEDVDGEEEEEEDIDGKDVDGEEIEDDDEEEEDIDVDGYINGDFDGDGNRYSGGGEPLGNPDSTSSDYSEDD